MAIVLGHNPIRSDASHRDSLDGPYCDAMTGAKQRHPHPSGYCHHRAKFKMSGHRLCGMHTNLLKKGRVFREADDEEMVTVRALIVQWRGEDCVLDPDDNPA